jgi:hypothetical protein
MALKLAQGATLDFPISTTALNIYPLYPFSGLWMEGRHFVSFLIDQSAKKLAMEWTFTIRFPVGAWFSLATVSRMAVEPNKTFFSLHHVLQTSDSPASWKSVQFFVLSCDDKKSCNSLILHPRSSTASLNMALKYWKSVLKSFILNFKNSLVVQVLYLERPQIVTLLKRLWLEKRAGRRSHMKFPDEL